MNKRTAARAATLRTRLWSLTDPYLKSAYGDMVSHEVAAGDDNIITFGATFTDDSTLDLHFDQTVGAYVMRDEIKAAVDQRCADIRKARRGAAEAEATPAEPVAEAPAAPEAPAVPRDLPKFATTLAQHQPKTVRGVGRGGKPGLLVECECGNFESFIADIPFSDTRGDLRLDFGRHQANMIAPLI